MKIRSVESAVLSLSVTVLMLVGSAGEGWAEPPGLNPHARKELRDSGLSQYVGQFEPGEPEDVGGGWDKYTFDTDGGDGPLCIGGTPLTVFHQDRAKKDLLIVLDGGGACIQDFYACSFFADEDPPGDDGIFGESLDGINNPFAEWSKLFVSYCDGSVFAGDSELVDPTFPLGPIRYHRGVRNLTAALDLARRLHPAAKNVLLSGISAGGYGVAAFAPSIYRLIFPPSAKLFVLNDSGPVASPVFGAIPQDLDWNFSQFYPASCTDCSPLPGHDAAFVEWTLDNDNGYTGALYSTDGDAVIRGFTFIPSQVAYRAVLLSVHDPINAANPDRYKRFIRSGSEQHTAIGGDGFYDFDANGVPLYQWVDDFVSSDPGWVDIVEDFVPAP